MTTRIVTGAEPLSVRGDITRDPRGGTDTLTRAWCDFDHFRLDFYVSTRMQERQEMVFHCRHGWIRVAAPFNAGKYGEAMLEICDARGNRRLERYPMVNQYTLQAEAFAESVRSGAAYACPLEFSRGNQAVVDALFVSAENGGRTTEVGGA